MKDLVSQLKTRLEQVAARRRNLKLWASLAGCWAAAALLGQVVIVLQRESGWGSSLALPLVALGGVIAALVVALRQQRTETDWRELAGQIEARHQELEGRLLTAVQQPAGTAGELTYLQDRLVRETLAHSRQHDWEEAIPKSRLILARTAHLAALVLFGVVLWGLRTTGGHSLLARISESQITVTPGDISLERGNSLVVLARFSGNLPSSVSLIVDAAPQPARHIPLAKSLADPMFGGSVPEVASDLAYHVEYAGQRTRDYKVTVFEHPRLERADATLSFPDYTAQPPKRIEDTRRLSAVEGSQLDLTLQLNKPVVSAQMVAKDKDQTGVLALQISTNPALAVLKHFPLEKTKTYDLRLVDFEGRTNKVPARFVFDVLKNRTPELKLASPRGDLRPSPLEEISFEGTVWDDFGVKTYGLGYTLAGEETKFVELGGNVPGKETRPFKHLLRLEDLGMQPDQLLAWFVWADDTGPDGQLRRTTGDLFFAEARPFEEVFREGQGMDGQSQQRGQAGQQGSRSDRLAELQKQIISATWKLQRDNNKSDRKPSGSRGPSKPAKEPGTSSLRDSENATAMAVQSQNVATEKLSDAAPPPAAALSLEGKERRPSHLQSWRSALRSVEEIRGGLVKVIGQIGRQAPPSDPDAPKRRADRPALLNQNKAPSYQEDVIVVRDAQAQALEQAESAAQEQADQRTAVLWAAAVKEMEKALARLNQATNSPAALAEALAAEQAASQALLKVQQHEYQVVRNRSRNQQGGGRGQQMQRQLEQMDLTQSENRYETQRQAQPPQTSERREQLQAMNRLQELARRQQDLNDRLKELQTALQEARTEEEREEIRRRLKRLQEEEQQMLADVDELRQRMDRPENQSRMAEERRQLEQTRDDVQRAAEAAGQGAASQALASGTRAQRQFQELRDQLRKENSSQFADELREMRSEARELSSRQQEILNKMREENASEHKSLSDSSERKEALEQLGKQQERLTNLVERATQVSQQAEEAEPLLSRQLYDSVRKFSQDTAKTLQETQDELVQRGLMPRSLYERLKDPSDPAGQKLLEISSEMLRQNFLSPAAEVARRTGKSMDELKRGVERAAESVLGDDTEALRLAQQQLDQLTEQLRREMAQGQPGSRGRTNEAAVAERAGEQAGAETPNSKSQAPERSQVPSPNGEGAEQQPGLVNGEQRVGQSSAEKPNSESQPSDKSQTSGANAEGAGQQAALANRERQEGQSDSNGRNSAQRGGNQSDGRTANGRDRVGGDLAGGGWRDFDRLLSTDSPWQAWPITGDGYGAWSDRLRDVEEMIDSPELRNRIAAARERARLLRQEFKRDLKKPDWAVVRLQVVNPLAEVRDRLADELARRNSSDALVPIDRDPVPNRYSELVRRYYEGLGKER